MIGKELLCNKIDPLPKNAREAFSSTRCNKQNVTTCGTTRCCALTWILTIVIQSDFQRSWTKTIISWGNHTCRVDHLAKLQIDGRQMYTVVSALWLLTVNIHGLYMGRGNEVRVSLTQCCHCLIIGASASEYSAMKRIEKYFCGGRICRVSLVSVEVGQNSFYNVFCLRIAAKITSAVTL